jgi:catechol 2,3-dioxygenase-like lactoylglutathione lyase family enzyme
MILGVDHLALSCDDVRTTTQSLTEYGYRLGFLQTNMPNHELKRPFLGEYNSLHSVAYCVGKRGVALELTDHGGLLRNQDSHYQLLMGGDLGGASLWEIESNSWSDTWQDAYGCKEPKTAMFHGLHAQYWFDRASHGLEDSGVRALLIPVANAEKAEHFWQRGLGCQRVSEGVSNDGTRWRRIAFRSPTAQNWSLDIILAEKRIEIKAPMLDDSGFPCLAILTTSMKRDMEKLWETGVTESTGEFMVEVNGRTLKVLIFRGPDDELIELIEIQRAP